MNQFVYLAGAMSGMSYDQANDWRLEAQNIAPYWVQTISPFRGKSYLKKETCLQDHDDAQVLCTEKAITARDYNDVKRSVVVLVNLLNTTKVSIGTVMEIAWAKSLDIPCVLIIEKGNIHQHAMINASCGFVCGTLQEGMDTVATITGDDKQVETYMSDLQEKQTKQPDALPTLAEILANQAKLLRFKKKELKFFTNGKCIDLTEKPSEGTIKTKFPGFEWTTLGHYIPVDKSTLGKPLSKETEEVIELIKNKLNQEQFEQRIKKSSEGTTQTKVQTRFPTDNVSTTAPDYDAFLNNPVYNTITGGGADSKSSFARLLSDATERINQRKEISDVLRAQALKQRNIDINIKAPAPKTDRVCSWNELFTLLFNEKTPTTPVK